MNKQLIKKEEMFIKYGSGHELIVCIPGFGCNDTLFDEFVQNYKDRYSLLVFDISKAEMPDEFELRSYAQILLNEMESQKLFSKYKNIHLLGISMGGFIAQIFASVLHCPASLSLWCTQGPMANGFCDLHIINNEDLDKLQHYTDYQVSYGSIKQTVSEATYSDREKFLELVRWKEENLMPIELMKKQNDAVAKFHSNALPLERITCPVNVILAEGDRLVNPENAEVFNYIYGKNLNLKILEGLDHLFFKEDPIRTHDVQDHFFKQFSH